MILGRSIPCHRNIEFDDRGQPLSVALPPDMVEQDLHADGDENESADDLHPLAEDGAQPLAEVEPRGGEGARDDPDHDPRVDDPLVVAEHAEADPHRERVDAGRHRQHDQGPVSYTHLTLPTIYSV